jgi:hypothetical protein
MSDFAKIIALSQKGTCLIGLVKLIAQNSAMKLAKNGTLLDSPRQAF